MRTGTWNYRIVKYVDGSGYGLHEVHYTKDGVPKSMSATPAVFVGDDVEDIQGAMIIARTDAMRRPVFHEPENWSRRQEVSDDAGNGDALNVGATPVDLTLPEVAELESKRWDEFKEDEPYIAFSAYTRLKAERDKLRERLTARTEEATKHLHRIERVEDERDVLLEQMKRFRDGNDWTNPSWYAKRCLEQAAEAAGGEE